MATCPVNQSVESGLDGAATERFILMENLTAIIVKELAGRALVFLCGLVLAGLTSAQNLTSDLSARRFLDTPETTKYAVIMTGPAVGNDNAVRFRQWSLSLHDILTRDYGYSSKRSRCSMTTVKVTLPVATGSMAVVGRVSNSH